ncbi:VOC family protein [Rhizobium jaguaris]|uniref:VOC family protein n=1 Tax=Rhizobium jaguaris TaxID=1312183 RepID=UPI0039BEF5AA
MRLSNYLFFTTNCEQALVFYETCGLGKIVEIKRYGVDGIPTPPGFVQGQVMHAKFQGPGVLFYASDNDDAEPMRGSAHLLEFEEPEQTKEMFARLTAGGMISTPLGKQPWSNLYGKLTDQFGVQWMLNCTV